MSCDIVPPATARAKIQAYVSSLRQAIGQGSEGPLLPRPPGYMLRADAVELDLALFGDLVARAKEAAGRSEPAAASELLATALGLWRGRAFADVESAVIRSAADKLEDRRLLAQEAKAEADLALGHCDSVVAELSPRLAANPFRERMRAALMLALYRLGCRANAITIYRDGRQLMVAERGLEPGPQLRGLYQRILADDPGLLPAMRQAVAVSNGSGARPARNGSGAR